VRNLVHSGTWSIHSRLGHILQRRRGQAITDGCHHPVVHRLRGLRLWRRTETQPAPPPPRRWPTATKRKQTELATVRMSLASKLRDFARDHPVTLAFWTTAALYRRTACALRGTTILADCLTRRYGAKPFRRWLCCSTAAKAGGSGGCLGTGAAYFANSTGSDGGAIARLRVFIFWHDTDKIVSLSDTMWC
jgi:hypothetical protein